MKKNKFILIIAFAFICCLGVFTGCGSNPPDSTPKEQKLSTPVIKWDFENERVCWDEIPNAEKYEVVFCDTKQGGDIVETHYETFLANLVNGTYSIKVKAISGSSTYINSDFSNKTTFTIKDADNLSYFKQEIVDDDSYIYLYNLGDLNTFDKITLYHTSTTLSITLNINDFTTTQKDVSCFLKGSNISVDMPNHDCYQYILKNHTTIFNKIKYSSNTAYTKSVEYVI